MARYNSSKGKERRVPKKIQNNSSFNSAEKINILLKSWVLKFILRRGNMRFSVRVICPDWDVWMATRDVENINCKIENIRVWSRNDLRWLWYLKTQYFGPRLTNNIIKICRKQIFWNFSFFVFIYPNILLKKGPNQCHLSKHSANFKRLNHINLIIRQNS